MQHYFRIFPVFCASFLLAGCATLVSGQTQDVTILTPGATEAQCTLDNGIRYRVKTGETVSIMRNQKDIVIDCYASGNRHRAINIESDGNAWAIGDIATGVIPGLTFDHFAKGLYEYPEVITVDFVGVPATGFDLPDYHNKDAPSPYGQSIESYGPAHNRLDSDGEPVAGTVAKKNRVPVGDPFGSYPSSSQQDSVTPLPGTTSQAYPVQSAAPLPVVPQGDNAEDLNRSMNPTVFKN